MRTLTIATAVLGAVVATLTAGGAATAATGHISGHDARAQLIGHRTCTAGATAGITRRTLVLDNSRSGRRTHFKVVRVGDRFADRVVRIWVPAHGKKSVTVSAAQRTTVPVRIRVPQMGRGALRLATSVPALASCYVATVDPKASLGGVTCRGADSVARVVLDNRSTSDDSVVYRVESSYGDSSASFTVRPGASTNDYLPVPAGRSTHVDVTAEGRSLLSVDVVAISCSR